MMTIHRSPGGTQIWFGPRCAAGALKPVPVFKGQFAKKNFPFFFLKI